MIDKRTPAEVYRDMMRAMRADVGFRPDVNVDGSAKLIYRGPRGEIGVQPIYRGQAPERVEQDKMKTAAIGINNQRVENEPDLELTAEEMMVVHRWLAMALNDVTMQLAALKPPAIMSKAGRDQVATTITGTKFLKNWINANMQQIEGALEAAGIVPDVVLNADGPDADEAMN